MHARLEKDNIEMILALDEIRDSVQEVDKLCGAYCDYLSREAGFDEAVILIRDQETGGLSNPNPRIPVSNELKEFVAKFEASTIEPEDENLRLLACKLEPRDSNIGLLVVRSTTPMNQEMKQRARLACAIIDSALEHALAFEELESRRQELEAVFALDRLRDSHIQFDEMIDKSAEKILDFVPADASCVLLYNPTTDAMDIRFPSAVDCSAYETQENLKVIGNLAEHAFKLKNLVSAENISEQIGSAICIPLILKEDIIGAFLALKKSSEPFSASSRRILSAMASQIDTAIFETFERRRIKGVFSRYVAADVVNEMLRTDHDFFKGRRKELTVLFSDLRGFTSTSEKLDTDVVVGMLNEHLSTMTGVVLRNHGTLDKFIGDCVMAFWGAPMERPDHALMAVRCALQMTYEHKKLMERWQQQGLPSINIGIGLNTGDMFVGNIGDDRKSSYTVIGDNVNLASRLEGVARGGEVLVTKNTMEHIADRVKAIAMEPVRVKGKKDPIELFRVLSIES